MSYIVLHHPLFLPGLEVVGLGAGKRKWSKWGRVHVVEKGLPSSVSGGFVQGYLCSSFGGEGRPAVGYNGPHGPAQIGPAAWASLVTAAGTVKLARPVCHMGWEQ